MARKIHSRHFAQPCPNVYMAQKVQNLALIFNPSYIWDNQNKATNQNYFQK